MDLSSAQPPKTQKKPAARRTGAPTPKGLDTSLQYVKGVGPKLQEVLSSRGFHTVRDLVEFFPRGYQDRTKIQSVAELEPGVSATVMVRVANRRVVPLRGGRKRMLEVRCRDEEDNTLSLRFFSFYRSMEAFFEIGKPILVTGMVKDYRGTPQFVHPEVSAFDADASAKGTESSSGEKVAKDASGFGRVVPIYSSIEGIPSKALRKIMWSAVQQHLPQMQEDLPLPLVQKYKFASRASAIRGLHFPHEDQSVEELMDGTSPAHQRLIYEELLKFEYLVLRRKLKANRDAAPQLDHEVSGQNLEALKKELPFELTEAQLEALSSILKDLRSGRPMNRLLQGDVGSGKTVVALLAAALMVAEGSQAVMMAPTEILAEQHGINVGKLLPQGFPSIVVTGKTKEKDRARILNRLRSGEPTLVIGTHAVFEGWLEFSDLDLVIIDEQHRFGVEQRRKLRAKGQRKVEDKVLQPHVLVMSATPIPRTLALTAYGDLDVSSMKGLPPGRSPIETKITPRREAYLRVLGELLNGRQAYIIYPLVAESEAEGFQNLGSAIEESERLQQEVFPQHRVGLLHGQMKSEEKDAVMAEFKAGKIHILVSTTVVEVGVDVPNATVMVIENAERFGLSQLHQLRGRVGRGQNQSYCHLVPAAKTSPETLARLEVMEKTNDGFKIAEADLEIRGPGEFLGTRQSGGLPFKLANLVRDQDWLLHARDDAIDLLRSDPNLTREENLPLRRYFLRDGRSKVERLGS